MQTQEATSLDEEGKTLVRGLSVLDVIMIVVGSMIGSGTFLTSAESARLFGASGWLLVAWICAGVMTITGAFCVAELAVMMPKAGGQYVFFSRAYHPSRALSTAGLSSLFFRLAQLQPSPSPAAPIYVAVTLLQRNRSAIENTR